MELSQVITWPPSYTVKKSSRAKHVRLSIHPQQGLTIHLPQRLYQPFDIDALLAEKKQWILKHLNVLTTALPEEDTVLPTSLSLSAIDETWQIDYRSNCVKPTLFAADGHRLVIMDKDIHLDRTVRLLQTWLKRKAQHHLIPWLTQLSQQHQLPFNKAQIRSQKTLWGSCSTTQNIQLNYKLLFLPQHLAKHILLHELAHIKHLNHSPAFWRLLAKLDAHCQEHNRALRMIETKLPAWLYRTH